jgi:hypothetical protein
MVNGEEARVLVVAAVAVPAPDHSPFTIQHSPRQLARRRKCSIV